MAQSPIDPIHLIDKSLQSKPTFLFSRSTSRNADVSMALDFLSGVNEERIWQICTRFTSNLILKSISL